MTLLQKVIALLQETKGDWVEIASDNEVSYSWITKLGQGKIPDPSVNTIERLHIYLLKRVKGKKAA